jgi:hypothetical protein
MMEALDPNYHSELAQTLLAECERLLGDGGRLIGRQPEPGSGAWPLTSGDSDYRLHFVLSGS